MAKVYYLRLDCSTGDECISKGVKPTTVERTMEVLVRIYHQEPVAVGADAHEDDDLREEDLAVVVAVKAAAVRWAARVAWAAWMA